MDSKLKWNTKYNERLKQFLENPSPNPRLTSFLPYLKGGHALDLACGLGGNSFYLAELNYQVDAVDISEVAINFINNKLKGGMEKSISATVEDITDLRGQKWFNKKYDLVVICYYLDRSLFPFLKDIIKENGYLFIETYYQSPFFRNENISSQYKLMPSELLNEFGDWKVLLYEENEHEGRQTIFCQRR